ncbi:excinuclease ABC subunit UvrA [Aquisphaera insulae]|uniref:excinuclease ABC subunit UvrA n=1 Tax=Aquisphaera insulae TaxID=2712864 RepID=UPI0020302D97|nr:excinuclease ABC subunit UvrA [Aquisphaera insulae]
MADNPSPAPSGRVIRLRRVRTHNLKGIDLDLPAGALIVVTGVSGAGKSSLAFDTLYAEGQRRYVETFSAYARQFLEPLEKPDAERIENIPPAVAVAGRESLPSPRSTVGTIAEVHEHLALLFARIGAVRCLNCGRPVSPATPAGVADAIDELPEGTRYEIAFPVEILATSDPAAIARSLVEDGLTRARLAGRLLDLTAERPEPPAAGAPAVALDVIVDRLQRGKDAPGRRLDSIETAFARGLGRCRILPVDSASGDALTFVRGWRCAACGTDHVEPRPELFRYTSSLGACRRCEGLGEVTETDLGRVVPDPRKSLRQGAIAPWAGAAHRANLEQLIAAAPRLGLPLDVPFEDLSLAQIATILDGDSAAGFPGLRAFFARLEKASGKPSIRAFLGRWTSRSPCPDCRGARLRPEALAVKVEGLSIAELSALSVRDARARIEGWHELEANEIAGRILRQVRTRLEYLGEIGLDYLTLDRSARSLSGGELRRASMTRTLGTGLVNTLYVLDEPTIGLHPHEVGRLVAVLRRLRDAGNTLVAVEHEHSVIRASDHVIDLGPGAGEAGGNLLYEGPLGPFEAAAGSVTSDFLFGRKRVEVPAKRRSPSDAKGFLVLDGARGNNLKDLRVSFPLGVFCVVTGVSGAGKSTLVEQTLYPALRARLHRESLPAEPYDGLEVRAARPPEEAVLLDQSPIGRSGRSNPVTYLKAFDEIRRTFAATHEAKLRNYGAGMFSFNVEGGRCGTCKGDGYLAIDMQFLPDVLMRCPDCRGTRYRPEVLEIAYRGRNIAEVLDLTAREAFLFFRHRRKIQAKLRPLLDLGLDYLKLGQPAATLSGGEAQRLKLAGFLGGSKAALNRAANIAPAIYLLDEPTAGLHPFDMLKLIDALNALVDLGHSVIVIEHSPEFMACADWIIDLGPGAGEEGGRVVAEGTPEGVSRSGSPTGEILAGTLG